MGRLYIKRIAAVMGMLLFMSLMNSGVLARETQTDDGDIHIVDEYNAFSDETMQHLLEEAIEASQYTGMKIAIIITEEMKGQSSKAYADDYADRTFGDQSNVVLLINMDDREIWISTAKEAIGIYDAYEEYMLDTIYEALQSEDFIGATEGFVAEVVSYYDAYNEEEVDSFASNDALSVPASSSYSSSEYDSSGSHGGARISIEYWMIIVAFIIASVVTYWVTVSSRGKKTITARTYETGNSFVLNRSEDDYLRETTTRRHIPKNNSNSSSGGSSGGGSSHGGSGRSF